jgi:hypothetical protein
MGTRSWGDEHAVLRGDAEHGLKKTATARRSRCLGFAIVVRVSVAMNHHDEKRILLHPNTFRNMSALYETCGCNPNSRIIDHLSCIPPCVYGGSV